MAGKPASRRTEGESGEQTSGRVAAASRNSDCEQQQCHLLAFGMSAPLRFGDITERLAPSSRLRFNSQWRWEFPSAIAVALAQCGPLCGRELGATSSSVAAGAARFIDWIRIRARDRRLHFHSLSSMDLVAGREQSSCVRERERVSRTRLIPISSLAAQTPTREAARRADESPEQQSDSAPNPADSVPSH